MENKILSIIETAIEKSRANSKGKVAGYIPELANVDPEKTQVSIKLTNGESITSGDHLDETFTLQSTAKLVVLIGLLEEYGLKKVQKWVRFEPSGSDFASIARLDQFGPYPSNPMLNAGAISLCSHIPGDFESQLRWLEKWVNKLFNSKLSIDQKVFASERRTGDRNRSLAYLLKSNGAIKGNIEEILETYFLLCSFKTTIEVSAYLPMLLANQGKSPDNQQIISKETAQITLAIMTTCGIYNESGTHLVHTGLPAKSGVSGIILASAIRKAGIAVMNPRVNAKGTSTRGQIILEHISKELDWHFASI